MVQEYPASDGVTITLPDASTVPGKEITIKQVDGSTIQAGSHIVAAPAHLNKDITSLTDRDAAAIWDLSKSLPSELPGMHSPRGVTYEQVNPTTGDIKITRSTQHIEHTNSSGDDFKVATSRSTGITFSDIADRVKAGDQLKDIMSRDVHGTRKEFGASTNPIHTSGNNTDITQLNGINVVDASGNKLPLGTAGQVLRSNGTSWEAVDPPETQAQAPPYCTISRKELLPLLRSKGTVVDGR